MHRDYDGILRPSDDWRVSQILTGVPIGRLFSSKDAAMDFVEALSDLDWETGFLSDEHRKRIADKC